MKTTNTYAHARPGESSGRYEMNDLPLVTDDQAAALDSWRGNPDVRPALICSLGIARSSPSQLIQEHAKAARETAVDDPPVGGSVPPRRRCP
jgi:hypothetical protein